VDILLGKQLLLEVEMYNMNTGFIGGTILLPKGEAVMRIAQTAEKIKLQKVMDVSADENQRIRDNLECH
jgi:hypothetical protein